MRVYLSFIAVTISSVAMAQDFGMTMSQWNVDAGMALQQMQMLEISKDLNAGIVNRAGSRQGQSNRIGHEASIPTVRNDLRYFVSDSAFRSAQKVYVSRLRKGDPDLASSMEQQLRIHDFGQVYSGIVAPFGLHRGDISDTMTAYTLLGWMIANGSTDPTREQVSALRTNVAANLAANPKFADSATRAAIGEEIVISFVTLHAGWQSARREGKLQQYSDGVAAMFRKQTGNDLRQLVLTDRGLEKRG